MNADQVREALDRGALLLRERERPAAKKTSQIRLSNALACVRRMWLLDTGRAEGEELSAETLRIFDTGTARGASIADSLIAGLPEGWEGSAERPVYLMVEGQAVPGHIDIALYGPTPDNVVVEVKTMNPWAFKRLTGPEAISDQYVAQHGSYVAALAECAGIPARGVFLAENKADSTHKILDVPDALLRQGAEAGKANLGAAIRAIRDDVDPGRPFGPNEKGELPWNCAYCSVWKACWGNEAEEVPGKKALRMVKR